MSKNGGMSSTQEYKLELCPKSRGSRVHIRVLPYPKMFVHKKKLQSNKENTAEDLKSEEIEVIPLG